MNIVGRFTGRVSPRVIRLGFATVLLALAAAVTFAQSSDDQMLREAGARIDRLRKADVTLVIRDKKGRPVPNARIRVEQTRHAFLFGCAALSLTKHADAVKEQEYQKRFADLFNFATVLTYWQDTDPQPDTTNFDLLNRQVERLNALGITVKGHPMILAGASQPINASVTRRFLP